MAGGLMNARRLSAGWMAAIVSLLLALAVPPRSGAFIYWTNAEDGTIGRANLDGTAADQSFIAQTLNPCGLAASSSRIYWLNSGRQGMGTSLASARLDGSHVDQDLYGAGLSPCGVAVDSSYVYWANGRSKGIARAPLDGSGAPSGLTAGKRPCGVAVDGSHIYWANYKNRVNSIGRANLDGTGGDESFITGADRPCGVAVDGSHIYWANAGYSETIGRANLDGSGVEQNFITGVNDPSAVAVDGSHIYWVNRASGPIGGPLGQNAIGRANLDGSDVQQDFIPLSGVTSGVAVDSLTTPPNAFTVSRPTRHPRHGTATLIARVPWPGTIRLEGKAIRGQSYSAASRGLVRTLATPTRAVRRKLEKRGRAAVEVRLTYSPTGGTATLKRRRLTLRLQDR
jgi:virginiamycin B lyase